MRNVVTSKVTERSQTTLPPSVRTVLGLKKGERLGYVIEGSNVRLINASAAEEHEDPVLDGFLAFLARDMKENPSRVKPFPAALLRRARELTGDVEIDHGAPIEGATAL